MANFYGGLWQRLFLHFRQNHCEIAKCCPEYISSVVKVSSYSYQQLFYVLSEIKLAEFEFFIFVII